MRLNYPAGKLTGLALASGFAFGEYQWTGVLGRIGGGGLVAFRVVYVRL
jgi:hypothetical protein